MIRSMFQVSLALLLTVSRFVPAAATDLVGWAAVDALGQGSTIGGGDGAMVQVSTRAALVQAAGRSDPLVILVSGTLTGSEAVNIHSHKTIIGLGDDATLDGFGLDMQGVSNIVIRNLKIRNAVDAIALRGTHHVWIDHCDLSMCSDGLLDITKASDYVTVSWVRFSNHHKTSLVSSGTSEPDDVGTLNTTFHHCWWDGSDTRNPRIGYGQVHIFNCLYNDNHYGIGTHSMAHVLAESNYFTSTRNAIQQMYSNDPANPFYGHVQGVNNIFAACSGTLDAEHLASLDPKRLRFRPADHYLYDGEVAPPDQVPVIVKPAAGVGAEYGVVPLLPIPGDGAIDVDIQPTLSWTRHPEAVSYKVYAGDRDDPELRANTTERRFTLPRLEAGAHFYWRVEAVLADSSKVAGPLWRFRVRAPFATGPQPKDQMTGAPLEGMLSWRPGAGAKAQKLHFGSSNPPPLVASQNETQFFHGELTSGTTYYWRVDQVVGDQTIAGKVWRFTTLPPVTAGPGRVEAEDLMLRGGYYGEDYRGASGGRVAAIDGRGGSVQYQLGAPDGTYSITIAYVDESDGASPFELRVNGTAIGTWEGNEDPRRDAFRVHTFASVYLPKNATIQVVGSRGRGELARIDYIETTLSK